MEKMVDSEPVSVEACSDCGVEVREGSEYCYNCGHEIAKNSSNTGQVEREIGSTQTNDNGFQTKGPGAIKKDDATSRRTRRPIKARSNEPVQVVWERRNDTGVGFLIVSVIAGLLALLLIFIAYYLK